MNPPTSLAYLLHLPVQLATVPGELMKRRVLRLDSTAVGGVAFAAALAALLVALMVGDGFSGSGSGLVSPLVVGGAVGALCWLLLTGPARLERGAKGPATVRCTSCGTEVYEDWRLCPYCGVSSESDGSLADGGQVTSSSGG
jgi:hypothetical protein